MTFIDRIYTIREPWFTLIGQKKKTIEGRLNKGRYKHLKKDDIMFFKTPNKNEIIKTKIINLEYYSKFKDYLLMEGIKNTLPGIKTLEEGIDIYYKYYNKSSRVKYNVVAIELEVIELEIKIS